MNLLTINGILISADGSTYYKLTDHNREPIDQSYDVIEKSDRMADGTMRKYVVAKKKVLHVSWKEIPSPCQPPQRSCVHRSRIIC